MCNVAQPVKWLATLTAVSWVLGSNPGKDMDVCKCIVPVRHEGTLNSRRTASLLVWLVEDLEHKAGVSSAKSHIQSVISIPLNGGGGSLGVMVMGSYNRRVARSSPVPLKIRCVEEADAC
ncbi:hypothetical protein TNCV_4858721 [Trichonephila clavipes]|nr:hypothetical protein TNCV_4858721 [Trichonephila clavipes]